MSSAPLLRSPRRQAYGITAFAVNEWLTDYASGRHGKVDPLVRVELERIRDAMSEAAKVPELAKESP